MVSSDFGKLEVSRHLSSGIPCAMAGLAIAVAAVARPAARKNSRRFIDVAPWTVGAAAGRFFAANDEPQPPSTQDAIRNRTSRGRLTPTPEIALVRPACGCG